MEKLGLDIDSDPPTAGGAPTTNTDKKSSVNAQEARRQSIERCIKSLEHATYCDDKQCQIIPLFPTVLHWYVQHIWFLLR